MTSIGFVRDATATEVKNEKKERRALLAKAFPNSIIDKYDRAITKTGEHFKSQPLCHERKISARDLKSAPTLEDFLTLSDSFMDDHQDIESTQYRNIEHILITPTDNQKVRWYSCPANDLTTWHKEKAQEFDKDLVKAVEREALRQRKIDDHGEGHAKNIAKLNSETRDFGRFVRDNLTVRGQVYRLCDKIFSIGINELLPFYGERQKTSVGARVTQAWANGLLTILGYVLTPVTFGFSKIATGQTGIGVSVGIEAATSRLLGLPQDKIRGIAAMRTVQLEAFNVPVIGDIAELAETGVSLFGISLIVSSFASEIVMKAASDRYASKLGADDLGESRVLSLMTDRLKYLSQYLIPHGQNLLFAEKDNESQEVIKEQLRALMDTMRAMEIRRTKALYYYVLALQSGRVPEEMLDTIKMDCTNAIKEGEMDCHKMAKACLATLNNS